jgi:hypothetical protein
MAAKDRMKKRRQRINKNGGKTLSVLIDKETVAQLNQLKSHFQESQASLVARAIKTCMPQNRFLCFKHRQMFKSKMQIKRMMSP